MRGLFPLQKRIFVKLMKTRGKIPSLPKSKFSAKLQVEYNESHRGLVISDAKESKSHKSHAASPDNPVLG